MKFRKVLGLAATATAAVNPAVGAAINAVNALLPEEKRLPATATVAEVDNAALKIEDPQLRGELMEMELQLSIVESNNWAHVQTTLAEADKHNSSTRPSIANRMAWLLAIAIGAILVCLIVAAVRGHANVISELSNAGTLILALLGAPTTVVFHYFGIRTKEKLGRYSASTGGSVDTTGVVGKVLGVK